ncbi:WxL domain-containing protein [Lentibacillus cibarius]|uniref:WxL domain-containing protein n=1 Tax=Lentibacillus cibarius TaxID=2583219 RepID=A0A549YBG9_9BACI|nr:WxL domain-containing protein [Lentibacillus cibarius]TRM09235.1 WxL domain-containing protein [Lentibacillus cibarius]
MKFKRFITFAAVGILFVFSFIPTASATQGKDTSQAIIKFTEGGGAFRLDSVSTLLFGVNEIKAKKTVYKSITTDPYVQVTDTRGTGEGWKVTAQASEFSDGEKETLPGSSIELKGAFL